MTRLEYMLTQLESHINNQTSLVRSEVSEGFESDSRKALGLTVSIEGVCQVCTRDGTNHGGIQNRRVGLSKEAHANNVRKNSWLC